MQAFTRKQRLLLAIVPPLAALFIRVLGATLHYRDINAVDEAGNTVPWASRYPAL